MKVVITFGENTRFFDLRDEIPNRIKQYELHGSKLTVWLAPVSESYPELFQFKMECEGRVTCHMVTLTGLNEWFYGDTPIPTVELIG
jgi:hypothetical protein